MEKKREMNKKKMNETCLSFVIDLLIDIACGFMFHENETKQRIETIEPNFENCRVFG